MDVRFWPRYSKSAKIRYFDSKISIPVSVKLSVFNQSFGRFTKCGFRPKTHQIMRTLIEPHYKRVTISRWKSKRRRTQRNVYSDASFQRTAASSSTTTRTSSSTLSRTPKPTNSITWTTKNSLQSCRPASRDLTVEPVQTRSTRSDRPDLERAWPTILSLQKVTRSQTPRTLSEPLMPMPVLTSLTTLSSELSTRTMFEVSPRLSRSPLLLIARGLFTSQFGTRHVLDRMPSSLFSYFLVAI